MDLAAILKLANSFGPEQLVNLPLSLLRDNEYISKFIDPRVMEVLSQYPDSTKLKDIPLESWVTVILSSGKRYADSLAHPELNTTEPEGTQGAFVVCDSCRTPRYYAFTDGTVDNNGVFHAMCKSCYAVFHKQS